MQVKQFVFCSDRFMIINFVHYGNIIISVGKMMATQIIEKIYIIFNYLMRRMYIPTGKR